MANGDLELKSVILSLEPSSGGRGFRPAIHGGEVVLPNEGFTRILAHLLGSEMSLPQVQLRYVSSTLIDGGAEIVMRAKRGVLDQNVRTKATLTPAGNGDLRVTVTSMRVGMLPADWLLEIFLGSVDRVQGLRKGGPKSIDVNLSELLRSRDVPVDLHTGVSGVDARADTLTIRF